ncbi:MAG: phage portal protein [Candidatus Neomicrothrix subdominans]
MLDEAGLQRVLTKLSQERARESARLARIDLYYRAEQLDLYVPAAAGAEFRKLVEMAHFNILKRVVKAPSQNLYVDGYRPTGPNGRPPTLENSPIWSEVWQANRMDARQTGLYQSAIKYGVSYATVLRGDPAPIIIPRSPRRCTVLYDDPATDEWPRYAMTVERADVMANIAAPAIILGGILNPELPWDRVRVWDETHVYTLTVDARSATGRVVETLEHGLRVCPVVRFPDEIDLDGDCPQGKVEPLIPLQQQIDQTTYSLLMTQQYQAFRQRWATGMAIETDEAGKPIQPWNASVAEVWANESPEGRFGDFAETSLAGYLDSRTAAILFATSVAQIPPHHLIIGNAVSNISADALVALESAHRQDVAEHQTVLGEAMEQLLRLAGLAHGDDDAWSDMGAQVVWRDTTPRSLAQVADAYGKMASLLAIPVEALWERIPGVTDQDIARWTEMRRQSGLFDELTGMLGQGDDGASEAADLKAKFDAMGVAIRSGVDSESAAAKVGLEGLEFTGGVPVSLRLPEADAAELEQA